VRRRLAVLAAAALAAPAFAAAPGAADWKPVTVEKRQGSIVARLTYDRRAGEYGLARHRDLRLSVRRDGRVVRTRTYCPPVRGADTSLCGPGSRMTLRLLDVWGDAQPEALLEIFTGGAHCCTVLVAVLTDEGKAGRTLLHEWGNAGWIGERRNGTYSFVSGDDRFAYAFTSYAASAFPMQVWTIDAGGRLVDVTRSRPDLIRPHAAELWRTYLAERGKHSSDVRGVLAAWCGDQYLLGAGPRCRETVRAAVRAGYLRGPGWPQGQRYAAALDRSLRTWGYRAS
jgi:hypothetical protein